MIGAGSSHLGAHSEPIGPGQGAVGKFLEKNGEGFHHLAFRVDGLEKEIDRRGEAGLPLLDQKPRDDGLGALIAFADPDHTQTLLTELVERERDPFDTEPANS